MSPSTRIGAASPVSMTGQMDDTMKAKATNDIAGLVETIAKKRGRNVEWAKKAVTEAAVVTDDVALEEGVIDVVAKDLDDLLAKSSGREVTLGHDQKRKLELTGARIVRRPMTFKQNAIFHLADPNLVYLFMIIGMLGLYAEFSNPGMVLPGVVGGIALLLFAVSTQILPINALGLLLIAGGIVLFILEFKFTSYGALTAGGVVLMVLGSLFLFENTPDKVMPTPDYRLQVSWAVILPSVIAMGAFTLFVAYKVVRAQIRKGLTGQEGIVGETGVAATDIAPEGKAQVQGVFWDATADEPIAKGAKLKVVAASGLNLKVKKL
jgi:membrane-bound serine protease (ClpP class)